MNTSSNSTDHSHLAENPPDLDKFVAIFSRINHWDGVTINKIYSKMNATKFGKMARFISFLGDPRLWIGILPLFGIIGLIKMDFTYLVIFSAGFFQSMVTYYLLKFYFRRKRPFKIFLEIIRLDKTGHGYSFPSGHCHHSTILMGLFWLTFFPSPWFLIPLLAYNILIALSRMASGCHFPSDVIVGIIEAYVELAFYWLITRIWYLSIYESIFQLIR